MNQTQLILYKFFPKDLVNFIFSYLTNRRVQSYQTFKQSLKIYKYFTFNVNRQVIFMYINALKKLKSEFDSLEDFKYYQLDFECMITGAHLKANPKIIENRMKRLLDIYCNEDKIIKVNKMLNKG